MRASSTESSVESPPEDAPRRAAGDLAAIGGLFVLGTLIVGWYLLVAPTGFLRIVVADLLFTVLAGGAGGMCLWAWRQLGASGQPWLFFGLALLTWCVGMLPWDYYEVVRRVTVPYPSIADVGFLAFYPLFITGLLILIRRSGTLLVREVLFDLTIVVVVFAVVAYELLIEPFLGQPATQLSALLTTALWQLGTIVMITFGLVAVLLTRDLSTRIPLAILYSAVILFGFGNIVYAMLAIEQRYSVGDAIDLTWFGADILIGIAAILAVREARVSTAAVHATTGPLISLVRGIVVAMSLVVFVALTAQIAVEAQHTGFAVSVVVIGVLLSTRVAYSSVQDAHLRRRTRERDRLASVVESTASIANSHGSEEMLQQLVASAAAAVGCTRATVYLYGDEDNSVASTRHYGLPTAEEAALAELAALPVGAIASEREMLATQLPTVCSIDDPSLPGPIVDAFQEVGKLCTLVTPLVARGQVLGTIDLWTPHDRRSFDPVDIATAGAIGQQAGLAIHNLRLLEQARQHAAEQQAIVRVAQAVFAESDLSSVLAEVVRAGVIISSVEGCAIARWHPDAETLELAAVELATDWQPAVPLIPGSVIALDQWAGARRAIEQREVVPFTVDGLSGVMIPLVINQDCFGLLGLFGCPSSVLSADMVAAGERLAVHTVQALDHFRLQDALRALSLVDELTQLHNRRSFLTLAAQQLAIADRSGRPLSLLFADLDGLKDINDTLGHQVGDDALKQFGQILECACRTSDIVARLSGDEFVALLTDTSHADADAIIARIHAATAEASCRSDARYPLAVSIGVAFYDPNEQSCTLAELLARADRSMYARKRARRNTLVDDQHDRPRVVGPGSL